MRERKIKESVRPLRAGDMQLCYSDSHIDYDDFLDDIESLLGKDLSRLVLKIADECIQDEEEEDKILAHGRRAVDDFYDSCCQVIRDQGEECVAIFLSRFDEITNFYLKLCKI